MKSSTCRFCNETLNHVFVDLGTSPMSNAFLKKEDLNKMEPFYPLRVFVCNKCFLVQLEEFEIPQKIFSDYAYFSSYSETWLDHAKSYVSMMIERFGFDNKSQVIEIASNDGYLLQFFKQKNIPILGIEPAENVAKIAIEKGIPTITKFFGIQAAKELKNQGKNTDLLLGNNVLAHVPDLNDFVEGMKILLKPDGKITMEFPHLLKLIQNNQFDTIYHEHFSYFSLLAVQKIFLAHGLIVFDVDEISTHGGSLRIYVAHKEANMRVDEKVNILLDRERKFGFEKISTYTSFSDQVKRTKRNLLDFLIKIKNENKIIVGYGAPAKGNTLLNYCGIGTDFIDYTVDRSPHKQGLYMPGTHIPIMPPEKISETKPDYLFIFPWNIKDEIMTQMSHIRNWSGKFVVPIPEVKVYS